MLFKKALFISIVFFIAGLLTLPHYGINWDTINHLPRGQAYLHFFLTGKKDYSDLLPFKKYYQKTDTLFVDTDLTKQMQRRSLYQSDATTFNWFMEHDGKGHPPLSDLLSAFFNRVFFGNLGIINDIDSYRVYGVFLSSALVGLIFFWVSKNYGGFAGLISSLSLALYPLFWSESHFNTEKDIPETVFWSFFLFSFWKGFIEKSWKWFIISGVFFGLGIGTKFNILFALPIIGIWSLIFLMNFFRKRLLSVNIIIKQRKIILSVLSIPAIGFLIFLVSWPYLWADPLLRIAQVFGFYHEIGTTLNRDVNFLGPFGINTYPLQWILYTTPENILFLATVGIIFGLIKFKSEKNKFYLLILIWFLMPILRVSWPGSTIYGGIRQIMEYIPAMAILAGIGATILKEFLTVKFKLNKVVVAILILASFIPIFIKIIEIHPNENVYFNSIVGGLSGAKSRNIPAWGNSFGAAYREAVGWINQNAEQNSKVVLVFEHHPNIPSIFLRSDLELQNRNRSGYLRLGEYALTLTSQGTEARSYYDMYLNKFIEPVFEVKVDGVAIAKVWKNDSAHLKNKLDEKIDDTVKVDNLPSGLRFDLGEMRKLSRLEIRYSENSCGKLTFGEVSISSDGLTWNKLPGILPDAWRISILGQQPSDGKFIEPFVGQEARYIDLNLLPKNTCLKNIQDFKVFYFN